MPKIEAIVDSVIPKSVEKPIPIRVVNTKNQQINQKIAGQPITNNSPVAESAPPEESVRLSPQLSALARKEQAFRQREAALKQREKDIESKLVDADKFSALKQKLGSKDFSEAEALGLSYEDYTKYVLEKQDGEDPVKAEMERLKAEIESLKKGTEENAASQFEETVSEYKKEISKMVAENPEFSTIKGLKKEDAVLQLILETFEEDGEELTVSEASKLVEEHLVKVGNEFNFLPKFKKEDSAVEPRILPRPVVGKTITNDMTMSSEKRPYKSLQHLSEAERYAEARRRVLERREKGK